LAKEDPGAVHKGLENLGRHLDNVEKFGVPAVVAVNCFTSDTEAEVAAIQDYCSARGTTAVPCTHWADGSAGTEALARSVLEQIERTPASFRTLYPDDLDLWGKIERIAQEIYGAASVTASTSIRTQIDGFEAEGCGHYPVCMAKTQYSFSTDPARKGAPSGHTLSVREVRIAAGAEFLVAICGNMMTMPGLPRVPAANRIRLDAQGQVEGLF
jgi:formate--tetrahydrofolate ligase